MGGTPGEEAMRLELREIIHVPDASRSFQYDLDLSELDFYGRRPIVHPVQVQGSVTNHAGALVLEGTARSTLELVCDRCAVLTPQSAAEWQNKNRNSGWRNASRGSSPRPQARETQGRTEKEPSGPRLYLRFSGENAPLLEQTKTLLRQSPGRTPVVIFYSDTGKRFLARQELWVTPGEELIRSLGGLLSSQNVVLR